MRKFKVLKKNGVQGLTVGSKSLPAGSIFFEKNWTYGAEALEQAIKNGRCAEVNGSQKEKKSDK